MDKRQQELAYFISFCIEQYKVAKGLSGEDVVKIFNQYKVMEYLSDCCDALHTQGHRWLVAEIDDFISKRKEEEP